MCFDGRLRMFTDTRRMLADRREVLMNPSTPAADYVHDPDSPSGRVVTAIYALQDAEALFRARLRSKLAISTSELATVQYLARLEIRSLSARPTDVAAHLGMTSGSASIIVARLVARGYVERLINPGDGRGQHLRLTEAVRGAVAQASGGGTLGALGGLLGLTDRESRRVVTLLTGVTTGYTDGAAPDRPAAIA